MYFYNIDARTDFIIIASLKIRELKIHQSVRVESLPGART